MPNKYQKNLADVVKLKDELNGVVTDAQDAVENFKKKIDDADGDLADVIRRGKSAAATIEDEAGKHGDANNNLQQATDAYNAAQGAQADALETAQQAVEIAEASQRHASAAEKNKDNILETHEKIASLLAEQTATVLAEAYRQDGKSNIWVDALHWGGMAVVLGVIVALHIGAMDKGDDGFQLSLVAVTLPLWVAVAMISRSWNDRRMVRNECAHAARLLTAIAGFKHESAISRH